MVTLLINDKRKAHQHGLQSFELAISIDFATNLECSQLMINKKKKKRFKRREFLKEHTNGPNEQHTLLSEHTISFERRRYFLVSI